MSLATGTTLSAIFEFTKAGALYNPTPAPTLIDARYPDATSPSLVGLTNSSTGIYTADVFTSGQSTQVGTYTALAYTSDTSVDSQFASYVWLEVGINNVTVVGDKTGYTLTQTFPTNFSSQSIDSSGRIVLTPTEHTNVAIAQIKI